MEPEKSFQTYFSDRKSVNKGILKRRAFTQRGGSRRVLWNRRKKRKYNKSSAGSGASK